MRQGTASIGAGEALHREQNPTEVIDLVSDGESSADSPPTATKAQSSLDVEIEEIAQRIMPELCEIEDGVPVVWKKSSEYICYEEVIRKYDAQAWKLLLAKVRLFNKMWCSSRFNCGRGIPRDVLRIIRYGAAIKDRSTVIELEGENRCAPCCQRLSVRWTKGFSCWYVAGRGCAACIAANCEAECPLNTNKTTPGRTAAPAPVFSDRSYFGNAPAPAKRRRSRRMNGDKTVKESGRTVIGGASIASSLKEILQIELEVEERSVVRLRRILDRHVKEKDQDDADADVLDTVDTWEEARLAFRAAMTADRMSAHVVDDFGRWSDSLYRTLQVGVTRQMALEFVNNWKVDHDALIAKVRATVDP